jgi:hypothetical protein
MVDKIKSQEFVKLQIEKERSTPAAPSRSGNELREGFKTLSSSLSVAERVNDQKSTNKASSRSAEIPKTASNMASLDDAVRFSKDAINALEQVTAGSLKSENVYSLLSEDAEAVPVKAKSRGDSISVGQLADDLESLKKDLKDLFATLKQKADQTGVLDENIEASNTSVEDLQQAQQLAEKASKEIQFNPRDALKAYDQLNVSSVARLLHEGDDRTL